jgi:hypothetical protein
VELGRANELHAAFREESRTRSSGCSLSQEIRASRSFFARCGIPGANELGLQQGDALAISLEERLTVVATEEAEVRLFDLP